MNQNEERNSNWLTVCLIAIAVIAAVIAIFYGVRAYSNNNTADKNNNPQTNTTENADSTNPDANTNANENTIENGTVNNGNTNNNASQTIQSVNSFDNVLKIYP